MTNSWDSLATQEKEVKVPQTLTVVILVAQGSARCLKKEITYPQAESLLFYLCFSHHPHYCFVVLDRAPRNC